MEAQMTGTKRKFADGDRFRGKEDIKPAWVRERTGTVLNHGPGGAEYTVVFDDDPKTVTYVQSNWIERIESDLAQGM